jgi:hypothetical protein
MLPSFEFTFTDEQLSSIHVRPCKSCPCLICSLQGATHQWRVPPLHTPDLPTDLAHRPLPRTICRLDSPSPMLPGHPTTHRSQPLQEVHMAPEVYYILWKNIQCNRIFRIPVSCPIWSMKHGLAFIPLDPMFTTPMQFECPFCWLSIHCLILGIRHHY